MTREPCACWMHHAATPCPEPVETHCFVCSGALCRQCATTVLTGEGWVSSCGSPVCHYALAVGEALRSGMLSLEVCS